MSRHTHQATSPYRLSVIALMNKLRRRGWFVGSTWAAWIVVLKVMFAIPLDEVERATFASIAGGRTAPSHPVHEAWFVCGRRGGKSIIAALLGVFFSTCVRYNLAPGERGIVMIIASDRRQAKVIFRYVEACFELMKALSGLVIGKTSESITLSNSITIEIHTSSFRAVRGYTVVCAICDEIAFWPSDQSSNPDTEILNALRPAMSTISTAMLICLSSPYSRRGELYLTHQKYFGKDSADVLVIQADSRSMNPALPQAIVDRAYEDDPAAASAEYGAQFRSDIEAFVRREAVEACVVPGRFQLPPVSGYTYYGTNDPAGGGGLGQDEFTVCVAHSEFRGDRLVVVMDLIMGIQPPFSPEQAVIDFCAALAPYRITRIYGDRYAGEWPREQFAKAGITYVLTDKPKSGLYQELLPAINSGLVELLDHPRLINQLCSLERRTARGGRDVIDHPPQAHDDLANSAAIALNLARREAMRPGFDISFGGEAREDAQIETATIGEQVCDDAIVQGLKSGELFGFRR